MESITNLNNLPRKKVYCSPDIFWFVLPANKNFILSHSGSSDLPNGYCEIDDSYINKTKLILEIYIKRDYDITD